VAQPRPAGTDGVQHAWRAIAVLDIGGVDEDADEQTEGVGHDVALAALDLLAGIIAASSSTFGRFHALAVDDARRGRGLAPSLLPRAHHQRVADLAPQASVAPVVEVALDRRDRREVLRQQAPLAAGRGQI
jgi:GNAT superfamily N-acetyltransferase